MHRSAPLFLLLCLAPAAFPQTATANPGTSSATVQLVYVVDGSTLTTYNVDPQTFQATQVGTTSLSESTYPNIVQSPNGHTLYYTAYRDFSQDSPKLYVYSTNGSGVPNTPPVQTLDAHGLSSLTINPSDTFMYAVHEGTPGPEYTTYALRRFTINASNGEISQPVTEATYKLDSVVSGLFCSLSIVGMNPAGSTLYDAVFCSYPHGGASATYYERTVNAQTGALGPDRQIYAWNNNSGENGYQVQFAQNLMFVSVIPNNYPPDNMVDVYRVQPNVTTPLISCSTSMLANCGSDFFGLVHPSAQYLFMINSTNFTTDIDEVKLSSQQIVATSSTIPYEVQQPSPDGGIAYAANDINGALDIQIYGFNASNAQVTPGGLISVPSSLDYWRAAERH